MEKEKNYVIMNDYGKVDENPTSHISIRYVKWYQNNPKLDIRVWKKTADGDEYPSKGITFLTDNGPHKLTEKMVELGYGDSQTLMDMIKNRPEKDSLSEAVNISDDDFVDDDIDAPEDDDYIEDDDDEEYYDPRKELIK